MGSHLRKKSYKNFLEYMYFVRASRPIELYHSLRRDNRVVYHARTVGFSDLWIVAEERLDIKEEIVVEGYRSDYWMSMAPACSWDHSITSMWDMIREFDPTSYTPRGYIKTHWDEEIKWNERDEILFQETKYGFRKPLEPLTKEKYHIGSGWAYEWLERLPECCTIATSYFPETVSAYDPCLFMFSTKYEDFIVDLFSQLPVSVFFFKVSDRLFLDIHVKKEFLRNTGENPVEFDQLEIPLMIKELRDKRIIINSAYEIIEYFWAKDL